jgi:hypothetical protein
MGLSCAKLRLSLARQLARLDMLDYILLICHRSFGYLFAHNVRPKNWPIISVSGPWNWLILPVFGPRKIYVIFETQEIDKTEAKSDILNIFYRVYHTSTLLSQWFLHLLPQSETNLPRVTPACSRRNPCLNKC